jgi:hypothetical protein
MMSANKVYRKEDILKMGSQSVNAGFGIDGGPTYSIWFYKGGPNCYHRWNKRVYATFEGQAIDINTAKQIAGRKAEKLGYVVKNPSLVSQRMIDREDRGYYRK